MGKWLDNYTMSQRPELGQDSNVRYVLAKKTKTSGKTLIAFGINASTANKVKDDPTLHNLNIIFENLNKIESVLNEYPHADILQGLIYLLYNGKERYTVNDIVLKELR